MRTAIFLLTAALTAAALWADTRTEILSRYQKNGLRFVSIKGVPDQEFGGLMVKHIYGLLKIPVTITPLPGKRALENAKKGIADGESMRIMKIQEVAPTLIRLSPHISVVEGSVFSKHETLSVDGWDSLSKHTVGIVRGVQYVEDGAKGISKVHRVGNTKALMQLLDSGRVDLAVTARYNGIYLLKKMKLHETIKPLHPPVTTLRLYNYLHVKHRELAPIVEDHLQGLHKTGELQRLKERFSNQVLNETAM